MTDCKTVFWHEHQVELKTITGDLNSLLAESCSCCRGCNEKFIISTRWSHIVYQCYICEWIWHESCVPFSQDDIDHHCHPKHPLELFLQGPPTYSDGKCNLCQHKLSNFVYHCKLCDFSIDARCGKEPPPLTVDHPKCHDHALKLMVKDVSFICNACGTRGETNPFVCVPCSLMFHYDCVDLPHVININRHDHRVSHARSLSRGNRICEICRQDINWRYGAYSCSKCPNFFVHSKCATRKNVWDGKDLKDIPEEEVDTAPFRVIDEGVINHFSHKKHNLFLIEDVIIDGGEGIYCEACCRPISFERYYKCMECDFMLHEDCANLPLQKRHAFCTSILSLSTRKDWVNIIFGCVACHRIGAGFRYFDGGGVLLDVHCATLSWFRHRKLHPHTLFLTTLDFGDCVGCDRTKTFVLYCTECKYSLCFRCATLPVVIKHRCDDHYLFLSSGETEPTGKYWCEICEAEIANPEKWFYTCHDCGVACHIECVTGDSLNIKPEIVPADKDTKTAVVQNDRNTRPLCSGCGSRCRFPTMFKGSQEGLDIYICSVHCANEIGDASEQ